MMDETTQNDIRRLLKSFGVQVDQAITEYLAAHPEVKELRLRLALEDQTDYAGQPPAEPLAFTLEGVIRA
jgi:hypothetical protein